MTTTAHQLRTGNFTQNWSNTAALLVTDNWNGIASIVGYRGDNLTNNTSTDPQATLVDGSDTPVSLINASTSGSGTGGVHEITDDVVALQGSGTADAPHLVFYLDATGVQDVRFTAVLRELDATTIDQRYAVQYRIGGTGNYINLPAGAASGFDAAGNQTVNLDVTLPDAADNQSLVEIRVITNDAVGSDAMVGIDDIVISSQPVGPVLPTVAITDVSRTEGDVGSLIYAFTVSLSAASTGVVTFDIATIDGTATTADSDYFARALTGQTIPAGQTSYTFNVTVNSDTRFEGDEAFTVNLTNVTGATVGDGTGTGTIVDNDPAPPSGTLSIGPAAQNVGEGQTGFSPASFTVSRTGGSAGVATVTYTLVNGTTDTGDFTGPTTGTVTFGDGDTADKTIGISVAGDFAVEGNESFSIQLSNAAGATLGSSTSAAATILNDDTSYSIAPGSASEATGTVPLVVTRTGLLNAVSLNWAASLAGGDTATAADFANGLPSGTIFFATGATTATISVPVLNDTLIEGAEFFTVTLSGTSNGQTIAVPSAQATIVNDDQPVLAISDATVVEGGADGAARLLFTISTDQVATGPVAFTVTTANGSATAGSDYTARTFSGTIAAGESSAQFAVDVSGDALAEVNETVLATLSGVTGATIGRGQATGTIVNDDGTPTSARLFETQFTGFTGAGFAPVPTAAQLDSDVFRIIGLSDNPDPAYGGTFTTGDFARGTLTSNTVTGGGVYSAPGNAALILQPTGTDVADGVGAIEARILNATGLTADGFTIAFDWTFRNNEARSTQLGLSWSTDGVNFTPVAASAFSTPLAADSTTFATSPVAVTLTDLLVGDGNYLFLRWNNLGSSGSGSRDEVGIDNVVVDASLTDAPALTVADVAVTEGNAGTGIATLTLTRSSGQGTASVSFATADGTARAGQDYVAQTGIVEFADGQTSRQIQITVAGDTRNESNEAFVVNLSNATGFLLPDAQAQVTITNDDTGPIAIFDIQGYGHRSALVGQIVATTGVVTSLRANGFYLQDAVGDGDRATSDALFVFTGTAPTVAVGNEITLRGTVNEFASNATNLTVTQLISPTNIVVVNSSVALPAATLISTDLGGYAPPTQVIDDDGLRNYQPATDGVDYYESLEGMLVTVARPLVVAPTDGRQTYIVASEGVGATSLNDRFGLTISATDYQPEKLKIVGAAGGPTFTQGDVLGDVTGILAYFGNTSDTIAGYEINPTAPVTVALDRTLARETTTLVGDGDSLSYASFNVENLGPVAFLTAGADFESQADVDLQYAQHAFEVVNALKSPDIIGLQEIQDNDGANAGSDLSGAASAQKLIDAIVAAGGPQYRYVEVAPTEPGTTGGQPGGNIRNGYLFNPERVSYVDGSVRLLTDPVYSGTRRPAVAEFIFNGETFTAVNVHSTSRGGSDPLYGANQPPTQLGDGARTAQAQGVRTFIDQLLATNPAAKVIVNGDFNGFGWEAALQQLTAGGVVKNLYDLLPEAERYSYLFDGYYQPFDYVLVSATLATNTQFDVVHYNAGYPSATSATDHDQALALIGIARGDGAATAIADGFTTTEAALYRGTVLANDTGGGGTLSVASVDGAAVDGSAVRLASGALLTLRADGTFLYDPDGAFSALAAGAVATDSFAYQLTGGSGATVSVTVTGLDLATPGAGNDTVAGTATADLFNFGAGGIDTVAGGAGGDAFVFGAALTAADIVNGGSGRDVVGLQGNYAGLTLGAGNLNNVETLTLISGSDTRFGDTANSRYSYALGTVDANVAAGQQLTVNASTLLVGENLTFDGSAELDGSFLIYGGAGTDILTGGTGADVFYMADGRFNATDRLIGGAGADIAVLRGDYSITLGTNQLTGIETLTLTTAADTRFFSGGERYSYAVTSNDGNVAAGQTLTVNGGTLRADEMMNFNGSAELDGQFRLLAGAANDVLRGGAGADLLFGGLGTDLLTGGGGNDVFQFRNLAESNSTGRDTIQDFALGDLIDLSRLDADDGAAGNQEFSFIGTGAFTGQAGQLRAQQTAASTWEVSGDVNGDGATDFQVVVVLADNDPFTRTDFVL